MVETWRQLIDSLLERGLVKRRALENALRRHRPTAETVEKVLVEARLVTRDQLLTVKSELHGVDAVDLTEVTPDLEAGRLLPHSMAARYRAVCYLRQDDTLHLAAMAGLDAIALDYLRMRSGFDVRVRVSYAGDIEALARQVYPEGDEAAVVEPSNREIMRERVALLNRITPLGDVASRAVGRRLVSVPGLERCDAAPEEKVAASAPASSPPACPICRNNLHLTGGLDETVALHRVMETARQQLDTEAISLLMLESDGRSLFFKAALGANSREIVDMVVPLKESSVAGWVLANGEPTVLHDAHQDPFHNKETDRMLGFSTRSLAAAPVVWGNAVLGVMEGVNKQHGSFTDGDVELLQAVAAQVSVILQQSRTTQAMNSCLLETVEVLVDLLEAHGTVTRAHLMNVAQLATAIGREAGVDSAELEHLSYAGLLHDIGMSRTQAGDEREHPGKGAEMLDRVPMLRHLVAFVGFHHERWDGAGTYGLAGETIPLGARILAIAEAWCEEQPWEEENAQARFLRDFMNRFGRAFDPSLSEPFRAALQTTRQLRRQRQLTA